jgi:hypothetical protein
MEANMKVWTINELYYLSRDQLVALGNIIANRLAVAAQDSIERREPLENLVNIRLVQGGITFACVPGAPRPSPAQLSLHL